MYFFTKNLRSAGGGWSAKTEVIAARGKREGLRRQRAVSGPRGDQFCARSPICSTVQLCDRHATHVFSGKTLTNASNITISAPSETRPRGTGNAEQGLGYPAALQPAAPHA